MTRRGARSPAATVLVVVASVLLLGAALTGYARHAVLDGDQFANRATATLQAPAVRTEIADKVTDRLVSGRGADLIAVRPLISSAVSGVVGGGAFGSLFRRAALDAHRAVFDRNENTVALTVADVGTIAGAALRQLRPELADQIERQDSLVLAHRKLGSVTGDVARAGERVRSLSWILSALTVVAAAAALLVSVDRRRTVGYLGRGAIGVGVVIVLVCTIGRTWALSTVSEGADDHAAAGAVWDAFLGDLRTLGWVLAGCGAVVAAAAASVIRPIAVEGPLRTLWRVATVEPEAVGLRLVRAAALIVAGLAVILDARAAVQLVATLGGVYLLYKGLESVLRIVERPPAAAGAEPVAAPPPTPRRHPARRIAVPALAALLIAGTVAIFVSSGGTGAPASASATAITGGVCDGHAELCDKPLDEVVLPATHNAMSAGPGWYASLQDKPIAGQLADGIRGLLLDTHYGDRLADGRVRTAIDSTADLRLLTEEDGVSPASFQAAMRLRERLGFRGKGQRSIYLCHSFCELGATRFSSALKDIHDFLVTHPSEVVVMVNQDYVPPAAIVKAFADAGLTRYALTPPADGQWPTLREMIDSDHRLVVLAENHAGAAPWYQLAYQRLTQETPYSFANAAALTAPPARAASCAANRGPSSAPLFLINNWITTDPLPRPSNAAKVNAYAPLLARARECEKLRHRVPSLLAVDFYRRGDLFKVADTLNGVKAAG
jgi:hypothetical protein